MKHTITILPRVLSRGAVVWIAESERVYDGLGDPVYINEPLQCRVICTDDRTRGQSHGVRDEANILAYVPRLKKNVAVAELRVFHLRPLEDRRHHNRARSALRPLVRKQRADLVRAERPLPQDIERVVLYVVVVETRRNLAVFRKDKRVELYRVSRAARRIRASRIFVRIVLHDAACMLEQHRKMLF